MEASKGVDFFERHGEGVRLTKYGQILYAHAVGILNDYDRATEEIKQLQGSGRSSLRIAAGDIWGYVYLPSIIREYSQAHPEVLVHIDIVSHANRLDGLRNGTYDLAFGIIDPSVEQLYSLTFEKLRKNGFSVFGDKTHPLLSKKKVTKGDLERYRWVNHQFEFGLMEGTGRGHERDYAIKANTMMNTIQTLRGSQLLISASSGFERLFESFGLAKICDDGTGQVSESGAIYWGDLSEKPILRRFVEQVKKGLAPTL
ncbi:MAG: LysR family transcriptional regulator [Blastopirellula sp.]|nr:MAG: LysR family transcriptional regulator [Blastopirellula sp.]